MLNISINDISPHPLSSTKVLDRCYELIEKFPEIKFTLFIPIAYWSQKGHTATKKPLFIWENKDFCDILRNLDDNNFELGYHGYYHGIVGKQNNNEFWSLTEEECDEKIKLMLEGVKKANLENKFKKIFRPPAWRMSPGSIKSFKKNNF